MTNSTIPTLLMQAARSAAIADGVVPKGRAGSSSKNLQPKQTADTVEAALAMVAAGKGNKVGDGAVGSNKNTASRSSGNPHLSSLAASGLGSAKTNAPTSSPMSIHGTGISGTPSNNNQMTNNMRAPMPASARPSSGATTMAPPVQQMAQNNTNAGSMSAPKRTNNTYASPASIGRGNANSAGSAAHRLALASNTQTSSMQPPPLKTSTTLPTPVSVSSHVHSHSHSHVPQTTVSAPRTGSSGSSSSKKKGPPLRRGKWTPEEEAYANRLIMEFKSGLLPLTDGTTLRTFLSKLLNCDPMRISKKFVGNNCIGKQVFRRRTADINRLTPEQIQTSRAELSELERRFLERVAQTNRVKSSGVNNSSSSGSNHNSSAGAHSSSKSKHDDMGHGGTNVNTGEGLTPPWLKPPVGFKHGSGAALAAANLSSGSNRAALAGRALLQGGGGGGGMKSNNPLNSHGNLSKTGSAGLLALVEMQQRQNRQGAASMLRGQHAMGGNSTSSLLAAAAGIDSNSSKANSNLSGGAMAQLSSNASAAKMATLLKSGISRDQLSQLVRDHQQQHHPASTNSLSNMMERQSSLDALMSLDFQSLQSIDNLANLIQTGRGSSEVPRNGMKNWSSEHNTSQNSLAAVTNSMTADSNNNLTSLADARRRQSEGRMENLIRSLSSNNVVPNRAQNGSGGSNANFNNILQSMQNNLGGGHSSNSLLGSASALNLANMLRVDSSTGLTALRMQDGLAQRNSSVDDFLSLVASGDIPHQDPHMLNVPLHSVLQQQQHAAQLLAHQQLFAQAAAGAGNNNNNNNALSQHFASLGGMSNMPGSIASLSGLANHNSAASLLSQYASQQGSNSAAAAAVLAQQQQQQNMGASVLAAAAQQHQENNMKRKFSNEGFGGTSNQGSSKR